MQRYLDFISPIQINTAATPASIAACLITRK